MFKSTTLILIVGAITINGTLFQENKKCPTTGSEHYQAVWPETNNWTLSDPPCVDKNKQFLYRKCLNGKWDTEPECDYVQQKILSQCPDDFIETKQYDFCYKMSKEKEKFPPKCLHQDILPFEMYRSLMDNKGPFWMPVVRNFDNGLGFFNWIETSSLYKTSFEGIYRYNDTIKDKNCLLYYNSSYIEAVSCDEKHLSICAYKKFNEIVGDLCSSKNVCIQSDFMNKTKCICKATEDSNYPKAEFLQLFQNNVYLKLANETCSIGLIYSNGTYIWSNSKQEISYTYWSPDTIFDRTRIYAASTLSGWILTENQPSCSLIEKDIQKPKEPILLLISDILLQVTVYYNVSLKKVDSNNIFLYCFTDASALDLIYRYTNFTQNNDYNYYDYDDDIKLTYMFEPLEDGPGNYWCESFNYVSMEVVKSNTQFFYSLLTNAYEFVAVLRLVYESINPLSKDIIKFVDNNVFTPLYKLDYFKMSYKLRIMKIVDVDEVRQQILINMHLTAKNVSNDDHDEEYKFVKDLLEENLAQLKIEMLEFASVDYCMNETMANLHWPTTFQGEVNVSKEYCFESDGTRFSRLCQADFINGAKWAPLNGTCEIANQSTITQNLIKVAEDLDAVSLLAISKKYDEFLPLDIYLFGNIFKRFSQNFFSGLDPDVFIEIISNLMEVDQNILIESKAMKATDTIIEMISTYFEMEQREYESCQKNFFVKIVYAVTFGGISIKRDVVDFSTGGIQFFNSGYDIKEVIGDDIEAAVLLHKDVNSQSQGNAMVLVLFKNSFFIEKPSTKTLSKIFRIIVTGLQELESLAGPTLLLQNVENNTQKTCSFWNVDDSGGSWQKRSDSEEFDLYQSCKFSDTPYFALTPSDEINEINVTEILKEILESNTSASQKMTKLQQISRKYQEFKSFDVFLVGKILEKVNQIKDIDLEMLAETISNLQRIQKEVLQESQIKEVATDSILYSIDKILINHDYQKPVNVIKDNFMILIYDTNETNFSGLALLEHNHTYQLKILEGDVDMQNVSGYTNLESALVLSVELKGQFQEESRVIVTFFTNNSLFNEQKSSSGGVNKIFGVILPEIGKFSGPITILQKVAKNDTQQQCVHWNYNTTVSGSWIKDQDGKELSTLIECEFWHTTHFAVLVVDEDKYQNDQVLDWVTNISCFMSFLGLLGIFLTGIFFQKWRKNSGNKILLNFAFAMMLQIVLLYISSNTNRNSDTRDNSVLCTTIGMLLHYSVVSEFCWMLIIAFLQYKRFVQVLGGPPQHMLLKGCLIGWLFPLFPVALVFIFGNYDNIHNKVNLCYPSGLGLYLGVWFPVSTIILINFAFFASILYSVFYKKTNCSGGTNSELIFQWRLVFLLFFILGLSWAFGFLCMMDFGVVFAYLFCMTATMQGFVLFLFFIVFNVNTRILYMQACKRKCFKN